MIFHLIVPSETSATGCPVSHQDPIEMCFRIGITDARMA